MPLYRWTALVDGGGAIKGRSFARDLFLLRERVARDHNGVLMHAYAYEPIMSISEILGVRARLFLGLFELLSHGVRINEALKIIRQGESNDYVRLVLADCESGIYDGLFLSDLARAHHMLFPPFVHRLIAAGEQAGRLAVVCERLAQYYASMRASLVATQRSLMMPMITLFAGICLFFGIMYGIVPRFAVMYAAMAGGSPEPRIFALSRVLRSVWGLGIVGVFIACGILVLSRLRARSELCIAAMSWVPGYFCLECDWVMGLFLKSLGVALEGGVDLLTAIRLAVDAVPEKFHAQFERVTQLIGDGFVVSRALEIVFPNVPQALIAQIAIGEASGTLGPMLMHVANRTEASLLKQIQSLATCVQPAVMVGLGVCIALLLYAMYEPIMMLQSIIQ